MRTIDLIQSLMETERVPEGKKYLLLLDIDDTLLKANNIYIIKQMPDGSETKVTPDQYAKRSREQDTKDGVKYSYSEFRDPVKVANSIITGTPILRNLKLMDAHINSGWSIGILTARGLEDVVHDSIKQWLMYRDTDKVLHDIGDKIERALVHAINDDARVYSGLNDFDKKANVIRKYAKEFDRVKFIDDDAKNIEAVRNMCRTEGIKNVITVTAWR